MPVVDPPGRGLAEPPPRFDGSEPADSVVRAVGHAETLERTPEPVYVWHNPLRASRQDGAVFVWTRKGRVEVLGNFFTSPRIAPQEITPEFRSFSLAPLDVARATQALGQAP